MKVYLRTAAWIGLAGLALVGPPARSQEAEPAEQKERSFWDSVQDKSKSMFEGAEGAVAEAGRKALREAKESYFPILRESGYEVSEIRLTFSLAPAVELRIVRLERLSDKKRQALLLKYKDDKKATGILETVFAAEKVETEGLELTELFLTLGLHPRATVVLSPGGEKE
jgi:hypothetical protein